MVIYLRKNADIIVLRMQKAKRYRKYTAKATSKAGSNSSIMKKTEIINSKVFDNAVKIDNGNLSSEDDSYFSNTEDE